MAPGEERSRWVARYRASGLGLRAFAAEHGLGAGQLHYWVYGVRASAETEVKAAPPPFREVVLPGAWGSPGPWTAEIGLPDGTTVRLRSEADAAWAGRLVQALRRPCSP